MENKINLLELKNEVAKILEQFHLPTDRFGIVLSMGEKQFEEIAKDHPNRVYPDMITYSNTDEFGNQTFVQIMKKPTLKSFE